jgi:hypothetical protein
LYRLAKSGYQRALRGAECKAWADFRQRVSSGDTFKALAEFSGKSKSIPIPLNLVVNGLPTSDPAIIAEGCADHFFPADKPTKPMHANIIETSSLSLNQNNCEIPPSISDWEFEAAAKSLNCKSAPGEDGISAGLLLLSLPLIKPLLLKILNACFLLCFFPSPWKLVKVVVIGKPNKPDYATLNSFRLISLISNLAKLLEKVIHDRLIWYSRSLNAISDFQNGFREGRSTETAAHSLISFVETGFEEKKVSAAAFLNIKSAFDSAWHPAIIAALAIRSCLSYLLKLVQSFLTNRTAVFSVQNATFSKSVSFGCPQEAAGTLTFLMEHFGR